jgi:hypothetical protein
MYVWMYICMYVRMYVHVCVCVCMCVCVCVCVYIYIYIYNSYGLSCLEKYVKYHLNVLPFLKCTVHYCCYVRDKFFTIYIPIQSKIKSDTFIVSKYNYLHKFVTCFSQTRLIHKRNNTKI